MYEARQNKERVSRRIETGSSRALQSGKLEDRRNKYFIKQYYRPDGAPPATSYELEQKTAALNAMKATKLNPNQYFHCTTKRGYATIGNIKSINPQYGGKGGAGAALGGPLGLIFQNSDRGFSFASSDPVVVAEYFELNLAKAIKTNDLGWLPVVLIVSDFGYAEEDPQQVNAVKSNYGFAVDKRIYTGSFPVPVDPVSADL